MKAGDDPAVQWLAAKHRFFVPVEAIAASSIAFTSEQARQMARVLRLQAGELVIALDGQGREYLVELSQLSPIASGGTVLSQRPAPGEPATRVTLYQALVPREKFELVLQKGTEVGVSAFVPVVTERSLVREPLKSTRLERSQSILREAAEQSRRGRVPALAQAATLAETLAAPDADALNLFAWERATPSLSQALGGSLQRGARVNLWIGPEGGFSEAEADRATASGCQLISLGPRILRTETAGPVLAALVLYAAGEFG